MADRPKLWRRVCVACGHLDTSYAWIAAVGTTDRESSQSWQCPGCGSTDAIVARQLENADLDVLATGSL